MWLRAQEGASLINLRNVVALWVQPVGAETYPIHAHGEGPHELMASGGYSAWPVARGTDKQMRQLLENIRVDVDSVLDVAEIMPPAEAPSDHEDGGAEMGEP